LEGTPAYRIAEDLNKPVWVVSDDGSFKSLLGRGFLRSDDTFLDRLKRTMKIFNSARHDEAQSEKSMDLIASFPIQTSRGMLSRKRFGELLRKEKNALPSAGQPRGTRGKPLNQRFEFLDEARALCIEQWPAPDRDAPLNKWTFLVRKGGQWKIERITYSAENDLAPR